MLRLQDYVPTAEASMVSGTVTTYQNFNAQGLAEQTKSSVTKANGAVDQYSWQRSYVSRDSLLESKVTGTASSGTKGGQFKDATTFTDYDAHGNKVLVVEGNEANGSELSIRQMLYAADGSLLRMQQSALEKGDGDALTQVKTRLAQIRAGQSTALHQSRESRHISSNGDYLGEIAVLRGDVNNARDNWYFSSTIKEQHFSSELAAGNASERHTVRAGDTLQSLAQLYYGNADYWYLIAAANGLSSVQGPAQQPAAGEAAAVAQQLVEGMTLDIPVRASSFNSHNNFKPMDLATIIGDTTPTVPYLPPPPAAGCNAVATIVMIAVTVAVTAITGNPAAGASAGDAARQTTTAIMNGQFDWGGFIRGNLNPLNNAKRLAMLAVPAYGVYEFNNALKGNDRSQALFNPLEHGFDYDYKATAEAAVTAYVGNLAGVHAGGFTGSHVVGAMAKAGVGYAANVQLNRWAGNKTEFSFAAMMANMAGAGLTAGIFGPQNVTGATLQPSPLTFNWREVVNAVFSVETVKSFGIGLVQSAAQYRLAKMFGDKHASWNFKNVATDAFGNALGNSIVSGLSNKQTEQQAERKGNEAFEKAKAAGMTDTQASKVATDEMLSMLPPDKRRQLLIDNDGKRLSINFAGKNGKVDRNQGGLSMSMAGDDFRSRHASLVDFISDEGLWGNNQMLGLATGLLDKRAAYYSYDSIAKRGQQVFESAAANSQAQYNHINRDRIAQQQRTSVTSRILDAQNRELTTQRQIYAAAKAEVATDLDKWGDRLGYAAAGSLAIPVVGEVAAPILGVASFAFGAGAALLKDDPLKALGIHVVSDTINRFGFFRAQELSGAVFDTFGKLNRKFEFSYFSTEVKALTNFTLEGLQTYSTNKTKEQMNEKYGVK